MNRFSLVLAAGLAAAPVNRAFAADGLPAASQLPKNIVQISPVIPGMGEHWADPKDLPLGPIYGVSQGRVIFLEFMIRRAAFVPMADRTSRATVSMPGFERTGPNICMNWPRGHISQ